MNRMQVPTSRLRELLTDLRAENEGALKWLDRQAEEIQIDVPRHLETTVGIGHQNAPPCIKIDEGPADDDELMEVLRLVLTAMRKKKPGAGGPAKQPSPPKRR